MNFSEINACATELVISFASMETDRKWDQFLKLQEDLCITPFESLLATPEYVVAIFAGHIRFNDPQFINTVKNSINWPESNLEEHLEMMTVRRVASVAESRLKKWQEIKQHYPTHAAMIIFITHSLAHNPLTGTFLENLKQ